MADAACPLRHVGAGHGTAEAAARENAGHHIHQGGDRIALVPRHGLDGAVDPRLRIGGRAAMAVDRPVIRNRLAALAGEVKLAARHGGIGDVEDHRGGDVPPARPRTRDCCRRVSPCHPTAPWPGWHCW